MMIFMKINCTNEQFGSHKSVGTSHVPQETLCTLESVKAVGEVYAPVDCEARVRSEGGLIRCQ